MSKLATAIRLIKNNKAEFCAAFLEKFNFIFPDKLYLQLFFRCKMGYWLNLKNPKTFNEKMQWLKLYNRNPFYSVLVDKFAVKDYIAKKIGEEYVIPTLGVWNNAKDIDFSSLPDQFVLKTTNGGGGDVIICKDKAKFNINNAIERLNNCLKMSLYESFREWPYKNVSARIIAEKYMEDDQDGELRDYKFYTFNGVPKFMLIVSNRYVDGKKCFDYFDMQFNSVKLKDLDVPNSQNALPHMPHNFELMKKLCKVLADDLPFVRIDFYDINGKVYFGEMTFFDTGGFMKASPDTWEKEWGDMVKLPIRVKKSHYLGNFFSRND